MFLTMIAIMNGERVVKKEQNGMNAAYLVVYSSINQLVRNLSMNHVRDARQGCCGDDPGWQPMT
jgi:hypothetical protein